MSAPLRTDRLSLTVLALRRRFGWLTLGAVLFAGGAAFAAMPWGMYARDSRIARDGVYTDAAISDLTVDTDDDGGAEYQADYVFLLPSGERAHDRIHSLTRSEYEALEVGDRIRVVYDPARPSDGFPVDNGFKAEGGLQTIGAALLFSIPGALFAAFGSLFLWGLLLRLPASWGRLLQEGRSAEGVVSRVELGDENASQARLHYQFEDRFGTVHTGETEWGPRQLVADWSEGDAGQVRYGRRDAADSVWLGRGDLTFYR